MKSIQVPVEVVRKATTDEISTETMHASLSRMKPTDTVAVRISKLSNEAIDELRHLAEETGNKRFLRALEANLAAITGETGRKVPNFDAFEAMLIAHLKASFVDGWIYHRDRDDLLRPYAVMSARRVYQERSTKSEPVIELRAAAMGVNDGRIKALDRTWNFSPIDVARKTVPEILEAANLFLETDSLNDQHREVERQFDAALKHGFAQQYRIKGATLERVGYPRRRSAIDAIGHRCIMDIDESRIGRWVGEVETSVFDKDGESRAIDLPCHGDLIVHDLEAHEDLTLSIRSLASYEYKPQLRDSLILPDEQKDLLDILTSDTELLVGDIVQGKTAGNIVLARGKPGVGKTLTAEIYSEIIQRPLYSVHAGVLGTNAKMIAETLRDVLGRAERWQCVLLIDEADVFVGERGANVEQNAIVAEFLRVLESFSGLMFMTTNRPDDIDEAIISRCAAIIHYEMPGPELSRHVWKVMADNFGVTLSEALIDDLVKGLKGMSPRDIKNLMRLVIRVAQGKGETIDYNLFRRCAVFRGVKFQ